MLKVLSQSTKVHHRLTHISSHSWITTAQHSRYQREQPNHPNTTSQITQQHGTAKTAVRQPAVKM